MNGKHWKSQAEKWNEQSAAQVEVILEGQENLNRQQQEFQAAVKHREMTINDLREEINTR